ncbi:unnamed protein product [Caenorhabditis brenneri]
MAARRMPRILTCSAIHSPKNQNLTPPSEISKGRSHTTSRSVKVISGRKSAENVIDTEDFNTEL